MSTKATSVRLDPDTISRLDTMAKAMDRPRAWLMAHAIQQFVEQEEWIVEAVKQGMRSAEKGRTVPHADVEAWVNSWGSKRERKRPG